MGVSRTKEQMLEYLLNRSYRNANGCLIWLGPVAGRGYGVTCWEGKQVYVHRLMYAFHNPNEELNVVRHSCDTTDCIEISHLHNGTTMDNVQDKINKKRHIFGSDNYNSRFTDQDIVDIRNSPLNLYQLGDKYNVTPSTIHYIRARKTWKHVP